jgi:Uma2 family endonuclease
MASSPTLDLSSATAPLAVGPSPETAPSSADEALYEVVDGQRLELPPMGAYSTWIACELHGYMWTFAREHSLGKAVAEMLFILDRERNLRRRPDVAFVSAQRWPLDRPIPLSGDWDVAPDLAVEVVSPHDTASELLTKIGDYFTHGVRRVWVIYPEERLAYVYESPTQVRVLTETGELDGAEVLPGFRISLSQILQPIAATNSAEEEQASAKAE